MVLEAHAAGQFLGNYKNFSLANQHPVLNQLDAKDVHVCEFTAAWRDTAKYAKKEHSFRRGDKRVEMFHEVKTAVRTKEDFDVQFPVQANVMMVINDLKIGSEKYIHYFLQEAKDNVLKVSDDGETVQHKIKRVFLFSRVNKDVEVITAVRE